MGLTAQSVYTVRHSGRLVSMQYIGEHIISGRTYGTVRYNRKVHHVFRNLATGRNVVLKSLSKVKAIGLT